jgi:hypothetical protein
MVQLTLFGLNRIYLKLGFYQNYLAHNFKNHSVVGLKLFCWYGFMLACHKNQLANGKVTLTY